MLRRGCAAVGAVALVGLLAAVAPAAAADRVIAVDGVSKHGADVRVEILVEVPAGDSARKAADRALEAQGAKRAPEEPQSAAVHVQRPVLGLAQDRAELQPVGPADHDVRRPR